MANIVFAESTQPAPAKGEVKATGVKFKKNAFLKDSVQGRGITSEGPTRGRDEKAQTSEHVEFSKPLKEEYRMFLDTYVKELLELREVPDPANPGKTLYDTILSNPSHALDKQIADLLSAEVRNPATDTVEPRVSDEKINKFLERPEGWIITTQLWERQTALKLFALGLHTAADPGGERKTLGDTMRIRRGINQGVFNRFEQEVLERMGMGRLGGVAATLISADIGGIFSNSLQGFLTGGAIPPAIYGAYRTLQSYRREGLVFDVKQCSAALNVIKNDPAEKAFVKRVMGIDTDDFVVNGVNDIISTPGRSAETVKNADVLEMEALRGIYARQEFYTSLGIPLKGLDALPEQFLYAATWDLQQEQTGARWQDRVQDEFKPNAGGIRDTAGIFRGTPTFNINGLDFEGNLRRYQEARRKVLGEYVSSFITKEGARGKTLNHVDIYTKKIAELGTPEGKAKRTAESAKLKTTLTLDKGIIEPDKVTADTYKVSLGELKKARQEGVDALAGITVGGASVSTIEDAIKKLKTLNQAGVSADIGGTNLVSFYDKNLDINTRKNARYAGIPATVARGTPEYRDERNLIDAEFQNEVDKLNEDKAFVNETIISLQKIQTTLKAKQDGFVETSDTAKKIKTIDSYAKDYQTVTGFGITEADLQTLPFDQILTQINAANTANPAIGWPAEQNSRVDLRGRILHAVIEANARLANPLLAAPGAEFTNLTNPTGLNISENQLRTLTQPEITAFIIARGGAATPSEINTAIDVANQRFDARTSTISDRLDQMTEQINQQEAKIAGVNVDQDVALLTATKDLIERYGTARNLSLDILAKQADFVNVTLVTAADKAYTPAEIALNQPRGYYEFMNLLFDYRGKTSRNEYFGTVQKLLPPIRLAESLRDSLGLPVPPGADMATVLPAIQARINAGAISSTDFSSAIRDIVHALRDEGLVIAG